MCYIVEALDMRKECQDRESCVGDALCIYLSMRNYTNTVGAQTALGKSICNYDHVD